MLSVSSYAYRWKNKIVKIEDLNFDAVTYKVYYFDYDAVESRLKGLLEFQWIRNKFKQFWMDKYTLYNLEKESQQWGHTFIDLDLVDEKDLYEGYLPRELLQILKALYAVKLNKPIDYRYNSNPWLQISNVILNTRKEFIVMH